jgi:hypothetical protein
MEQKIQPKAVVHNSLGLHALFQRLQDDVTYEILELGPIRKGNIEFWTKFSNSIYVADLRSSLPLPPLPPPPEDDQEPPERDWHQLIGLPEERRFDIILAWDLLNYLDLSDLSGLIAYLSQFCRPETILFMLIFDSQKMRKDIAVYRIVDESHLGYELGSTKLRDCPRHHAHTLTQMMRNFRSADSFRLRNGIIEYLFIYEGKHPAD